MVFPISRKSEARFGQTDGRGATPNAGLCYVTVGANYGTVTLWWVDGEGRASRRQ